MIPVLRKLTLVLCFVVLVAAESCYFGGKFVGALLHLHGQHAFYEGHHKGSYAAYRAALAWGGDRGQIETDMVETLLFGLDQLEAGLKVELPLPPEACVEVARRLIADRIRETPYRAFTWSLASDIYEAKSKQRLRSSPIDLATLSEDPLENLLTEDWLSVSALQMAARLESTNYLYDDLLAEKFIGIGGYSEAAQFARQAVAAFPLLEAHAYLLRSDLAPEILEAAVRGFDDAQERESMVPMASIASEAGRLLAWHDQNQRAEPYLRRAVALAPDLYDAQAELGILAYARQDYPEALSHLRAASDILPDSPTPAYFRGLSHLAMGAVQEAIDDLREAREKGPGDLRLYHALGEALEQSGRYTEAERQFVAGTSLRPDDSGAWEALLAFYVRRHDTSAAYAACARLFEINPRESAYREQCASLGTNER